MGSALISISLLRNGQGNEGDESHGSDEGDEGHGEEAHFCKARQASCLCRQDRCDQDWAHQIGPREEQIRPCCQQEGQPSCQEVPMDCSCPEGSRRTQDQGFLSHQEGYSTLQESQGALQPVSALTNLQ